jgi:CRISPR-associated endonuclease/helicase Cas3
MYSHPHYHLSKHLQGVEHLSSLFLSEKEISIAKQSWFSQLNKWIAVFHDIGKANGFFQRYLQSPEQFQEAPQLKSHALLSAALLIPFLKENEKFDEFWRCISFIIVKRHHGNLDDWLEEFKKFGEETKALLWRQIDSIDFEQLNEQIKSLYLLDENERWTKEKFQKWLDDLFAEARQLRRFIMKWNKTNNSVVPYLYVLFLFSLLIDADKSEVGIIQKETWSFSERREIPDNLIHTYKARQSWKNTKMNRLREQAFQEVVCTPIDVNKHFYSLNLPTGMGKTLSSLQFALQLKAEIEKKWRVKPRIIYSLPFLSVIDQTSKVIKEIFSVNGIDVDHRLLLEHHHLADAQYTVIKDDERYDATYEIAKLLIEGWNAEIILTTFVQLFETIFSNKNSTLRKFHRLANAIFIIDEVQAVPHRYWLAIKQMFMAMAQELNCYFLFSSATDPGIFENTVLLVDPRKYFQPLSRVTLFSHVQEPVTIESFLDQVEIETEKTYLFIMNTIGSAKRLYEEIIKTIGAEEVTFLSTHIPPKERLRRIEDAKKGAYRIVISTQLIEAGVDIDFDVVYRDLAPLDSIQQAAGRCNRHGDRKGEVHVVSLTDGRRLYASYIYDSIRLDITKTILSKQTKIEEEQFLQLITEYFHILSNRMSNAESERLLKGMMTLYFDGEETSDRVPVSHFRLIEGEEEKINVFIELDEEAQEIFQQYEKVIQLTDRWERKKQFAEMKSLFYQYVISIPRAVDNKPPIVHGIGYVNYDSLEDFYDTMLGYKTKSEGIIW